MSRLNDQFMEAFTDSEGNLRRTRSHIGYMLAVQNLGPLTVELGFDAWKAPTISTKGEFRAGLIKGGIRLNSSETGFEKSNMHPGGLRIGFDDEYGDRKYMIADTDDEEVAVSFWDPNANTLDYEGQAGGQYQEAVPVSVEDAEVVKNIVAGMIASARVAIEIELASA